MVKLDIKPLTADCRTHRDVKVLYDNWVICYNWDKPRHIARNSCNLKQQKTLTNKAYLNLEFAEGDKETCKILSRHLFTHNNF